MQYASYNDAYKGLLVLTLALDAPEPAEIFKLAGENPSNSQLYGWRAGRNNKKFRRVEESDLLAFIDGLIKWADSKSVLQKNAVQRHIKDLRDGL